ncbi:hydrogenase maturation protease [Archaeoglobus veneficus]|uniref:Hydrogenase maturation protease n=1 Tax=Archaeoglobus veneficus (strain DSM 11195 / SNP6) TaxID=693661 RepID=F2KPP3_ARCVS|nr:hydrogenase maturation protease [Archaeoglobus veneficus]AEA47571.1 hydrogenase maturation protease [Archaeoglobus veneficus SNP6]
MNLVVCIGSETGNDSFGLRVARLIKGKVSARIEEATNYIDLLTFLYDASYEKLIVVDAVRGNEDYKLVEFDVRADGKVKAPMTHSITFFDAVRLAKALGILPDRVIVVGMEIASVEVEDEGRLEEVAAKAAERVAELCSE